MNPLKHATNVKELVSDKALEVAFGDIKFGNMSKREVIKLGTLKCLASWYQGYDSKTICMKLGLINANYKVTAKGRAYLWLACNNGSDV